MNRQYEQGFQLRIIDNKLRLFTNGKGLIRRLPIDYKKNIET